MTAKEIAARLQNEEQPKPITADRVKKLRALCVRSAVDFAAVLAELTDEQRAAVEAIG